MRHIAMFCGRCNCGCRIQMSLAQLADLVADVRTGVLDELLAASG